MLFMSCSGIRTDLGLSLAGIHKYLRIREAMLDAKNYFLKAEK
jgi:hypothetical protein